jgi:hypothetical protein
MGMLVAALAGRDNDDYSTTSGVSDARNEVFALVQRSDVAFPVTM